MFRPSCHDDGTPTFERKNILNGLDFQIGHFLPETDAPELHRPSWVEIHTGGPRQRDHQDSTMLKSVPPVAELCKPQLHDVKAAVPKPTKISVFFLFTLALLQI